MFEQIFIEEHLRDHPRTLKILKNVRSKWPHKYIEKIEDVWGRVKKPYLQKRDTLNLFIGEKKGDLVKLAPDAYGTKGDLHYYFIHAYNCIYECTYCYLQGYFNTPDLVLFINHEQIIEEISKELSSHPKEKTVWFHAGEFSDSLALSHVTGELPLYYDFFKNHPRAKMELRTKSANIRALRSLCPIENVVVSFSLSPHEQLKENDLKTPHLKARLSALEELSSLGHPVAIHFDPIIYSDDLIENYNKLIEQIAQTIDVSKIQYVSLGVVRFTKDVYYQVQQNYPDLPLHQSELIKSFDNKVRYNRPMRMWILNKVKDLCLANDFKSEQIYLCMEDD